MHPISISEWPQKGVYRCDGKADLFPLRESGEGIARQADDNGCDEILKEQDVKSLHCFRAKILSSHLGISALRMEREMYVENLRGNWGDYVIPVQR